MEQHAGKKEFLTWDFAYSFRFKRAEERFDKLWEMKVSARESLEDWLLVSAIPPRTAEICANACSELIENSIKHARDGSVVTVFIHVLDKTITVETSNKAEQAHREALNQSLAALDAATDPKLLFVDRLLNPVEGKSHLGLVKVVMETKGTLECMPSEDKDMIQIRLCMRAEER